MASASAERIPLAYALTGRVVDERGAAVRDAEISARRDGDDASALTARSDASGRYRLQLPTTVAAWVTTASVVREFNGQVHRLTLDPDLHGPFPAPTGAVRDFTWRVQGRRPGGGWFGSPVLVRAAPGGDEIVLGDVELTLSPVGTLIDGSLGQSIARRATPSADGYAVPDVPVGRYTISAREVVRGEPIPLRVRVRNTCPYVPVLTTDFITPTPEGPSRIVVEVMR